MCYCYEHKCNVKKCDEKVPIHLGGVATFRTEILVYCNKHVLNVHKHKCYRVFLCADYYEKTAKSFLCAIVYKTENAKKCAEDNYPNAINIIIDEKGFKYRREECNAKETLDWVSYHRVGYCVKCKKVQTLVYKNYR